MRTTEYEKNQTCLVFVASNDSLWCAVEWIKIRFDSLIIEFSQKNVPLKAVGGIRQRVEKKRDVKGNKRNAIFYTCQYRPIALYTK